MKRFSSLFLKDLILCFRNGHVYVVLAIALLMIALILFIPEEINTSPGEYLLDTLPGKPIRSELLDLGARTESLPESEEDLDRLLTKNPNSLGIVITGEPDNPDLEIIQTREITEQNINLLISSLELLLGSMKGKEIPEPKVVFLRSQTESIPKNLAGIPIFLAFEVGILGFLLVAVFIFQEKQEGTIKVYRTSPGGIGSYILSKTLVFTILGLVYGIVVTLAGLGFNTNWAAVIALILWSGFCMTLLGLGFAAWFNNISHWFFPGLAVLILNMLPFVTYIYPIFNPPWMKILPSYLLVFALREALFPAGNPELIAKTLLYGLLWLAGISVFSVFSVHKKLLKGA